MNTVLSFMDKIYGDSSTLSMIYIVGSILLFVFIVLLIFSLRKSKDEEEHIIEEPMIDKSKEITVNVSNSIEKEENIQPINETIKDIKIDDKQEDLSNILDKAEEIQKEEIKESKELKDEELPNLSSEIPSIDEYVDNVIKKTYEKNEQFSSVYVGNNTSTIKLDKVLDNLNVDEDIKEEIVPLEEKTVEEEKNDIVFTEENNEVIEPNEIKEDVILEQNKEQENNISSLDALKKSLDEKKNEVSSKQDDLKSKLDSLKNNNTSNETIKAEDLLNKLNSLKK